MSGALRPDQAERIAAAKRDGARCVIPIHAADGRSMGELRPIDTALAAESWVHEALCTWRRASMAFFLTTFDATPAKTASFLQKVTLADPARLLFLIQEDGRGAVGNIGVCGVGTEGAELDNVLRGDTAASRGLMRAASTSLLTWAFRELRVPQVYLNVLADNTAAIKLYAGLGFRQDKLQPLWRKPTSDGFQLLQAEQEGVSPHPVQLAHMVLPASAFDARHGSASAPG